jgi:hypothetical protein
LRQNASSKFSQIFWIAWAIERCASVSEKSIGLALRLYRANYCTDPDRPPSEPCGGGFFRKEIR